MRQLHVVPRFPVGTHTFVLWQVSGALGAGHDVRVLAAKKGNADGYRLATELKLRDDIVTYSDYRSSPIWNWAARRFSRPVREAARPRLFGRIRAERRKSFFCDLLDRAEIAGAELVQAHFVGCAIEVGIPLAHLLDVPVVVTAHSPAADFDPEQLRYVQESADAVVVVSDEECRRWSERTGSARKLCRVWNGAPSSGALQKKANDDPGLRLAAVSRLSPEKRPGDLITAMARLRDFGIPFNLDLFGDGPMRAEIDALVEKLGLGGHVRLHGLRPHDEIMQHQAVADIFVHASEAETFGLVLIEAMSIALPVVAVRSSGAADIVIDGETGFLTPPRDAGALATRIAALAADPERRNRMGEAGLRRFERDFSLAAHMGEMERVWSGVLDRRSPAVRDVARGQRQ
jgi:glycosyltransferase involved in cell wall biosynthesis